MPWGFLEDRGTGRRRVPAEPEPTSDDTNATGRFNDSTPVFAGFFVGGTARSLPRDHLPPPAAFPPFLQQAKEPAAREA